MAKILNRSGPNSSEGRAWVPVAEQKRGVLFLQNSFFYVVGIAFLMLAKAKNFMKGYSSPKTFDITETDRCIEYDMRIVDAWLLHLQRYTNSPHSLAGKTVLELGPGSDLGVGIYLLSKGCGAYHACDVNELMRNTPDSFYHNLFEKLRGMHSQADVDIWQRQWAEVKAGNPSRLNYAVSPDFDIVSAVGKETIDLVFSQAAFEHFDDMDAVVSKLSVVCKPHAILVVEIDLKTHSRWIRDQDPNNIYRYPTAVYDAFWFRGIPNRLRPFQYKEMLERHGWTDISILPVTKWKDHASACAGMQSTYADEKNQMDYLSIVVCARKGCHAGTDLAGERMI